MIYSIRRATADDEAAILTLVHSERIDANALAWEDFVVAVEAGRVTGAALVRRHADGSRELGTLVVARDRRGMGLAGRLIDALLSEETGPVSMITDRAHAVHYARWGFVPVSPVSAPPRVRRTYFRGLVKQRKINRLVILQRDVAGLPGCRPDIHARAAFSARIAVAA
jgi:amino-acid N-acetyltransferase